MSSPSKHPRLSISSINPDFQKSATSPQPNATTNTLLGTLRHSFSNQWPAWQSIRRKNQVQRVDFTILINDKFRTMSDIGGSDELVNDTLDFFKKVAAVRANQDTELNDRFHLQLEDAMIEAVFGSNAIESAGLDERLTAKICRDIFRGIDVKAEDIDERDPDYAELLQKGHQGVHEIIRSRAEVIQHAKALKYIVKAIVDNSEPLTEIIIKETHKILCHGENLDYPAGVYRNFQIGAKYGLKKKVEFMRPSAVPENMEKLCEDYNSDVSNTEITGVIDPMSLAARYCSTFVNIHPFADGNGRMCRLILNSILLKYAGICVPIGEGDEREREKYISLTTRASKKFYREHMEVEREDETAHLELGILVTKKSRSKLRALYEALTHPRKH